MLEIVLIISKLKIKIIFQNKLKKIQKIIDIQKLL